STTEIAKNLSMSLCVIQCTLQLYNEIGSVVKDPKTYAKKGQARVLDTDSMERHLDIYLDELVKQLMEQKEIGVFLSTIQWSLKLLGITTKNIFLSKAAAECCEDSCNHFQLLISQEAPEQLIFTDESVVNMLTTY
ncbi:hypothetical protein M422DRAFT_80444, partial [Sphaerobolus stellatus SS14]